ncbi:hypothetical protein C8J57DRAFT_1504295 [Mycena rebaudengoi]|nr:hypothetical protein C8J57DRAFT_1504295 [Mycena rebaudengoi]
MPEEHKLSLHLLSIVEPFVGLAPSSRTITRQPTEILDSITYHVDSKRDLLSLALSGACMTLVSSLSLWNHVVVHRSLARNVRRLEILDERAPSEMLIPPDILCSDTDMKSTDDELGVHEEQERYLVRAFEKMTSLVNFTWSCNHSPISIDNVWPTLPKCTTLQEIDISDNLAFLATEEAESDSTSSKARRMLTDLKTVAVRSTKHPYGSTKHPVLSRIGGMLIHCPNLKVSFHVFNNTQYSQYAHRPSTSPTPPLATSPPAHPTADELLLYSRFPHLTSLTLTNLRCTLPDAPTAFLALHTQLTHLHLDFGPAARIVLPLNALPHLRELHCGRDFAAAILEYPATAPRVWIRVRMQGSAIRIMHARNPGYASPRLAIIRPPP